MDISGTTRLCCLFGSPVAHSRSPQLHNKAFELTGLNYRYVAFDVTNNQMERAMDSVRLLNMRGCNLTMPNKIDVIPFLDKLDPAAELIGAVNTVLNEDGVLTGYNTDGYGFMRAFQDHDADIKGKKMTQMGMGGAGTSVAVQAAIDGAREISVFSPSTGKSWGRATEEVALIRERTGCNINLYDANDHDVLRREIESSELLANTTPIGMGKLEGKSPIPDASFLRPELIVQDAIYEPEETELLRMARETGCTTINGLEMLFYQGARAFEIWTGLDMPLTPQTIASPVIAPANKPRGEYEPWAFMPAGQ